MTRKRTEPTPTQRKVNLDRCLVVGIASSALFDLTESGAYFDEHGEAAYRDYQDERIEEPLAPGVAFPFVKRLLGLNNLDDEDALVEVIVLSKNDPTTGLRVMRSLEHHKLPITRAVFTQGRAPYDYIEALGMSLFLSAERSDVDAATLQGLPAGHVLPSTAAYDDADEAVRVAFDFDGVLADDASERVYKTKGLTPYLKTEAGSRDKALAPGPLQRLLADLNVIQDREEARRTLDISYEPRLRIALVTARNAPAHERAVMSLKEWGVRVNDAFFMGGVDKSRVLRVLKPHVFFDDQTTHLDGASDVVAGVHIPYGVANERPKESM
jgi:5'-nucleotidase